jgi:DNA-binding PadR family transcriptional regulator
MSGLPKGQKLLILRCLAGSARPLTPGQILKRDSEISEVGIYVALARMRADGLLSSTKDETTEGERGSPHRRYMISAEGGRVLAVADELEIALAAAAAKAV